MSQYLIGRPRFDMGRVIERTFGVIAAHPAILVTATALLAWAPQALIAFFQAQMASATLAGAGEIDGWAVWLAGQLLSLALLVLLQGFIAHVSVTELQNTKPTLRNSLGVTARAAPILVIVAILAFFGMALGLIILIVPGVILALMWAVTGPVVVIEKRGILAAFGRSHDLTRGNRWSILGLFVIYMIASWAIGMVLFIALAATGLSTVAVVDFSNPVALLMTVVVAPAVNALTTLIGAAGVAALYVELRTVKEGARGGEDAIAAVFD